MRGIYNSRIYANQHCYFMQLDMMRGTSFNRQILRQIQEELGADSANIAIDFIEFNPKVSQVFQFVFGNYLISSNFETALKVSNTLFHRFNLKVNVVDLAGNFVQGDGQISKPQFDDSRELESILTYHRYKREVEGLSVKQAEIQREGQALEDQIHKLNAVNLSKIRQKQTLEEYKRALELNEANTQKLEEEIRSVRNYGEELEKRKKVIQQSIEDLKEEMKNNATAKSSQEKKKLKEKALAELESQEQQLKELGIEKLELKSKNESVEATLNIEYEKFQTIKRRVLQMQERKKKGEQQIETQYSKEQSLKQALMKLEMTIKASKENVQIWLADKKEIMRKIEFYKTAAKQLKLQQIQQQGCQTLREELDTLLLKYKFLNQDQVEARDQIQQLDFQILREKLDSSNEVIEATKKALVGYNGTDFDQAQILLKQGLELRHRTSFWEMMLPFLEQFAVTISDLEKIKKIIEINEEIRKISDILEPDICAGIFPRVEKNELIFKFQCAKGGELRDADKELSGGQKSMIAFMTTLAFQKVLKVPFLLLDEIDAPLDVVNSEKVAKGLKKIMKDVQVITISHRKFFPQEADRVFLVSQSHEKKEKVAVLTHKKKMELLKSKNWWESVKKQDTQNDLNL